MNVRLDLYLVKNKFLTSRQSAHNLIVAGHVKINNVVISKPSFLMDEEQLYNIVIEQQCPFVSRGGLKLKGAFDKLGIIPMDMRALDIGASTGGFSDCLLQYGAQEIWAVDVGKNQLHEKIKNNPKVYYMENYNARDMKLSDFPHPFDIVVMDVSFISQKYILPKVFSVLSETGIMISLIKPQFEVGRTGIGKKGIVSNPAIRFSAVSTVLQSAKQAGLYPNHIMRSPIDGGDGNIEYIFMATKNYSEINFDEKNFKKIDMEGGFL